jgi:hypothetical protein
VPARIGNFPFRAAREKVGQEMSTEDLGKLILLIAGLLALLASSLIDSGDTTQATLEWVRGHDTQAYIATLIGLAAVPFYLGGVVADWLSMR